MFKVDFFEFYALLERFITLCLSILGVSVSSSAPATNVNALRFMTNPEFARTRAESSHRFHANLLEALDAETSPLRSTLGDQDVRIQLGLAKDYRNRWKDADEQADRSATSAEGNSTVKLADLELEKMLITILVGCEQSLGIVHTKSHGTNGTASSNSRDFEPKAYETMEMDDVPLEYMDDAMDLD
jgi:hypothetical protein